VTWSLSGIFIFMGGVTTEVNREKTELRSEKKNSLFNSVKNTVTSMAKKNTCMIENSPDIKIWYY